MNASYYYTNKTNVNRTEKRDQMIEYLSEKYNLTRSAVIAYCISRVYNKEMMDEARMKNYLDQEAVK